MENKQVYSGKLSKKLDKLYKILKHQATIKFKKINLKQKNYA